MALTGAMMVVELVVGYAARSLALTADGWHMATHAGALGLSAFAYWFARRRTGDAMFTFGTGKVHALAGYTSAVLLMLVAGSMFVQAVDRLFHPEPIGFREALPVAVIGLVVNLLSVKLLHHGDHDEEEEHEHHHHDENWRAAYMHVVADAFTSVLAIVALVLGRWRGFTVLDPLMGIVGGLVVLRWGAGLCRSAGAHLLDAAVPASVDEAIRKELEAVDDVRVADLHVWVLGPGRRAGIVTLVTSSPRETSFYRTTILKVAALAHLTVEIHVCPDDHGLAVLPRTA